MFGVVAGMVLGLALSTAPGEEPPQDDTAQTEVADDPDQDAPVALPDNPPESGEAVPDTAEEGTGGAGGRDPRQQQKRGIDALGVPLVSYNSDLGWGIGLAGGGYYYSPGYLPYRHALAVQGFLTTEGVQNHWVRYDGPSLIGSARLEVRAEFRRELFAPYYGPGNQSAGKLDVSNVEQSLWSFDYFFPGGFARLRWSPVNEYHPLSLYAGYGYHWVRVKPYEPSALQASQPLGVEGGSHGQLAFGALWDSRDNESDPARGGVEELSIRIAGPATLSQYAYAGVTLSERRFWSLWTPKLILAQRVVIDALWGDAPFFEWSQIGGTQGGEGIGGMSSVRGVPRNRYQGKAKVVSNTELRWYAYSFPLFGEPMKVGPVAYFDLGRVWHPGVEDGPFSAWHPGAGTGVRLARRAAVVRFDYAWELETGRAGIYVTFGHMF